MTSLTLSSWSEPSPQDPRKHRDNQPSQCCQDKSKVRRLLDHQPDDESKSRKHEGSERRACRIQGSCFLAAPGSGQTGLLFAFPLMLLDKRGACRKNRRKS